MRKFENRITNASNAIYFLIKYILYNINFAQRPNRFATRHWPLTFGANEARKRHKRDFAHTGRPLILAIHIAINYPSKWIMLGLPAPPNFNPWDGGGWLLPDKIAQIIWITAGQRVNVEPARYHQYGDVALKRDTIYDLFYTKFKWSAHKKLTYVYLHLINIRPVKFNWKFIRSSSLKVSSYTYALSLTKYLLGGSSFMLRVLQVDVINL